MSDEKKDKGKKGMNIGCGTIVAGGCFTLLLLFIFVLYIIWAKPTSIWSWVVDNLNIGVELEQFESQITAAEAKSFLNEQINTIGVNNVVISEEYLTPIAREQLPALEGLSVDLEEGSLNLYWILESSVEDNPLLGYGRIAINNENNLEIQHLGVPAISFPAYVNDLIIAGGLSALNLANLEDTSDSVLYQILDLNSSFDIQSVEFRENEIEVEINVQIDVF